MARSLTYFIAFFFFTICAFAGYEVGEGEDDVTCIGCNDSITVDFDERIGFKFGLEDERIEYWHHEVENFNPVSSYIDYDSQNKYQNISACDIFYNYPIFGVYTPSAPC